MQAHNQAETLLQNHQLLMKMLGNTFGVIVNDVRIVSVFLYQIQSFAGRQLTQNSTDTRGKPNIITRLSHFRLVWFKCDCLFCWNLKVQAWGLFSSLDRGCRVRGLHWMVCFRIYVLVDFPESSLDHLSFWPVRSALLVGVFSVFHVMCTQ